MKKFILPVLCVCFLSCSQDDSVVNATVSNKQFSLKSNTPDAQNAANVYDYVGKLHAEILDGYVNTYQTSSSIPTVVNNVDDVAETNTGFTAISQGYAGLNVGTTQWTMDNINYPDAIMSRTTLSSNAKQLLTGFLNMFPGFQSQTDAAIYSNIKAFETGIINNQTLNTNEKKTILSTTSVARYTIDYSKDKTRRWDKIKNGVVASINTSASYAVTTSATANIVTL